MSSKFYFNFQKNFLTKQQVEQGLQIIRDYFENNAMQESVYLRGSIYRGKGDHVIGDKRKVEDPQSKKLSFKYLEDINAAKIAELKHVFLICDKENKGYMTLQQIETCTKISFLS